jgi:hypothetical protein
MLPGIDREISHWSLPLVAIVSRSAGANAQHAAGRGVYRADGVVGQAMFWAVNSVNADDDYGECAESRASYEHDCAGDQDENSHRLHLPVSPEGIAGCLPGKFPRSCKPAIRLLRSSALPYVMLTTSFPMFWGNPLAMTVGKTCGSTQ